MKQILNRSLSTITLFSRTTVTSSAAEGGNNDMSQNSEERGKKNILKSLQNYCDVKWRYLF